MNIRYSQVITRNYPNAEFYATGPLYSNIVWLSTPIPKAELDEKMLFTAKGLRADEIREESIHVRMVATKLIVGTSDIHMLRTYDEKKTEAERFLHDNPDDSNIVPSNYPALNEEATRTGVTIRQLAGAVIQQYNAAAQYLNPILGEIEAIRRNKIAEIDAAQSMTELEDIAAPTWIDLSGIQMI